VTVADPIPGFRFGVFFFAGGAIPNPVDIRFQRVSGLSASVELMNHREGGENLYTHRLPTSVSYGNLVLERGLVMGSALNLEFNAAMTTFRFSPSNVLVTLFDDQHAPVTAWQFSKAFPVKWATSDLQAKDKSLVIETLELAYTRMQMIRI
jgi:phage tail-like protein